ncbi:MAG: hypothetical protein ACO1O1_11270 [Adhaeribacter sp.]
MLGRLTAIYADILQIRFSDTFAGLPPRTLQAISPQGFWPRLGRVLGYAGGRLVANLFLPLRPKEDLRGKIWLYVVSKNNYESLKFLQQHLPGAVFVAGQNKQIGIYNQQVNRLSTRWKLFYYYKFPFLLAGLWKQKGPRAWRFFDLIFQATGYYELSLGYLRRYQPRAIIFANDHNTDPRALLLAAKALQVPTAYIQHASVSTSFPPLVFDLSLLEGPDALDKYRLCGPVSGQVEFIGMPKADPYLANKNLRPGIRHVGVCTNTMDDLEAVHVLLVVLREHFPDWVIALRPHPSDRRNFDFLDTIPGPVYLSDSKTEPAFDFLQKQDALIAADSSIHLEATMLNILSFYYRFGHSNFVYDYYGYVQNHLVEAAPDLPGLLTLLKKYAANRPVVYEKARYYNAVIGTEFEGKSHELAIRYLQAFLPSPPGHG